MPVNLPVVSNMAMNSSNSSSGNEATGSTNGARSEGGVSNDTNGPESTWTQPSANSDQSTKQASFGVVLSASVASAPKTKTKSSGATTPDGAQPTFTFATPSLVAVLPTPAGLASPAATAAQTSDASAQTAVTQAAESAAAGVAALTNPLLAAQAADDDATGAAGTNQAGEPAGSSASVTSAAQSAELTAAGVLTPTAGSQSTASAVAAQASASGSTGAGASAIELESTPSKLTINPQLSTPSGAQPTTVAGAAQAVRHDAQADSNSGNTDSGSGSGTQSDTSAQQSANASQTSANVGLVSAASPAAQAAVQSSSVAERVSVINQITQQVSASASSAPATGTQSVTVHVSPPHWGDMSINLTSQTTDGKAGPITATITTQSAAARDALVSHADDLKSSLSSSGIKLDKLDITTSDKGSSVQSTDGSASASSAQNSGMQSNTGGQQFGSQHNQTGSHTGQGISASLSDQNRGQGGQQNAFASMLSGDPQNGRGNPGAGLVTQPGEIDIGDGEILTSVSAVTSARSGNLNILA